MQSRLPGAKMCQKREEIGAVCMRSKEKIPVGTSHLRLQATSEFQASVKSELVDLLWPNIEKRQRGSLQI